MSISRQFASIFVSATLVLSGTIIPPNMAQASPVASKAAQVTDVLEQQAPHEALYEVKLHETTSSSNVASYEGLMSVSWRDTCDGFASDQRIVASISDREGTVTDSDFTATSWEGKDRVFFQFYTENKVNGRVMKRLSGKATRDSVDQEGLIEISKPKKGSQTLPASIMFPTHYTAEVLAAAQRGETVFEGAMFDGSDEHVGFRTTTTIGPRRTAKTSNEGEANQSGLSLLIDNPYWPVHVSYHEWENIEPLPIFEMSMDLHQNGVGRRIIMDYGSFSVEAVLVKLQFTPRTDC